MLVGGGELHDRWSSVVRTNLPLRRGIQRFTGITQAMVDAAPRPEAVLPEPGAADGGAGARRPQRRLRRAGAEAGVRPRRHRLARPARVLHGALARKFAPLVRRRGLASLADSLGIEVDEVHRALPDAVTCGRVLCALLPKLCANAITVGDALASARAARRAPRARQGARPLPAARGAPGPLEAARRIPACTSSATSAAGPLYVGKSVSLRTRARAHFCAPAGWTERAEIVDYKATNSELGALVLENRLIKQWQPPGNTALKRTDRWAYVRCRLDVEYPILEVSAEPAPGPRGEHRPAARQARSRASWPTSSARCSSCATAGARCAGASTLRSTARWTAAAHRVSATSTRTPTAARSTRRWRCSTAPTARATAARRDRDAACAPRRPRAATSPPPRCCAGASASRAARPPRRRPACRRTPRRGSWSPPTPQVRATTRSGSSGGAWPIGDRYRRRRDPRSQPRRRCSPPPPLPRAPRRCRRGAHRLRLARPARAAPVPTRAGG